MFIPFPGIAQDYYDASLPPAGEGTEDAPYRVESPENLLWLARQVNSGFEFVDQYFIQTKDIDMSSTHVWDQGQGWVPIGGFKNVNGIMKKISFQGHYDGMDYSINHLYINRPSEFQGLFGYIYGGSVRNLNFNDAYIEGTENLGILSGYAFEEEVSDCHIAKSTVKGSGIYIGGLLGYQCYGITQYCSVQVDVAGYDYMGGITSWCQDGEIFSCHASGSIHAVMGEGTGNDERPGRLAGGLVGFLGSSKVDSCSSTVEVVGGDQVGGLIGVASKSSTNKSFAICNLVKGITYVGGLIGKNEESAVSDCFARSTVEGEASVGGLIGSLDYSGSDVARSYAAGKLTTTEEATAGALVGNKSYTATIMSCYFDREVSGTTEGVGGFSHGDCECEGKATAEMKNKNTFAGWDFTSVWSIKPNCNNGYPQLFNENKSLTGDIDGNSIVDTNDVKLLINKILGTSDIDEKLCDIDGNGIINVSDVTAIIGIILGTE